MDLKKGVLWTTAITSSLIYLVVVIMIMFFFGWIMAIIFGLITGFLIYKGINIYEEGNMRKGIVEKMEKRKKDGVILGGKKFYLNKGVIHGDEIPGEDSKPNLGDLNQLGDIIATKKQESKALPGTKKKVAKRKRKATASALRKKSYKRVAKK